MTTTILDGNTRGTCDGQMVCITEKLIKSGSTAGCGWNRRQLAVLGVPWPLKTGWMHKIIGKLVPKSVADRFLALRKTTMRPIFIACGSERMLLDAEDEHVLFIDFGRSRDWAADAARIAEHVGMTAEEFANDATTRDYDLVDVEALETIRILLKKKLNTCKGNADRNPPTNRGEQDAR